MNDPVYDHAGVRIFNGDCVEVMRSLPANFYSAIVTDPPYELGFMGRKWDGSGIAFSVEMWKEALRVAKPGASLLAFGGSRTHHRMMVAIEDAGWEIRDVIMWLYGSGFPKGLSIDKAVDKKLGATRAVIGANKWEQRGMKPGKNVVAYGEMTHPPETTAGTPQAEQWEGYNTALKPAYEPIVWAMKPVDESFAGNALAWGVAGLNIEAGRIGDTVETWPASRSYSSGAMHPGGTGDTQATGAVPEGRWPANVILDEEAAAILDEQTGDLQNGGPNYPGGDRDSMFGNAKVITPTQFAGDRGGASRFFYTAKASRAERDYGVHDLPPRVGVSVSNAKKNLTCVACERVEPSGTLACSRCGGALEYRAANGKGRTGRTARNDHPTVKPQSLMRYLVGLVKMPGETRILDPFMGSGSTLVAGKFLNCLIDGVDLDGHHCLIAQGRLTQEVLMFEGD